MNAHTIRRFQSNRFFTGRAPQALLALVFATFAMLSLTGCVGLTGAGTPSGTKSSSSTGAGTLSPSAATLSFGNVVDGKTGTQTLTLTNTGTATVTISQSTMTGPFFSMVGSMAAVTIDP